MLFTTLAFVLGLTLAFVITPVTSQEPYKYCHGLDCPVFTQTTNAEGLELRSYGSNLWSSTVINSTSYDDAVSVGFSRLFGYISGDNAEKKTIDMTSPVLVKVIPGSGPNCASLFTVSFYLPNLYQQQSSVAPPKPTSDLIFTETIGAMDVAVIEYGGFAKQDDVIAKAAEEEAAVSNSTLVTFADGEVWYAASYDPPFRLTDRHNEVWIPVVAKTA